VAKPVLVVARWDEPGRWAYEVPGWEPLVVSKGMQLPNVGREASSFLWAMRQLYGDPPEAVAFVQGNPFPHCENLYDELVYPTSGFRWLGDGSYASQADGRPHHPGLPVAERYERWFGRAWPGVVWFAPGGQFTIPGCYLLRHPRGFYAHLQAEMGEGENPWVMERLWRELFREVSAA